MRLTATAATPKWTFVTVTRKKESENDFAPLSLPSFAAYMSFTSGRYTHMVRYRTRRTSFKFYECSPLRMSRSDIGPTVRQQRATKTPLAINGRIAEILCKEGRGERTTRSCISSSLHFDFFVLTSLRIP